jgi:uncharacterized sporulation protein YeaH/YhbH (DUF444 family)
MFRIVTAFLVAALLLAADNPWAKVKELQNRSELRIYKKGVREPITAVFDEANDDRIIVVVKDKQMAIPKEDIDRIDARAGAARKVNVEKTDKRTEPDYVPRPNSGPPVPGTSSSSNVSFGGKPDFQTIYRRAEGIPKN